jgi:uncharacterized metal-binding protein YceD (DUF177 family)
VIISVAPLLKQPIGSEAAYAIAEDPIDPRGENAGLREAGFDSVDARVTATHTNPGAYLEGDTTAIVEQPCSRCLRPVRVHVEASFAEQYYAMVGVHSGESLAEAPLDAKTIGSDFHIDLTPLIAEELILATPLAPLCRADCQGLCAQCGEDLNERPHTHDEQTDERWAALQKLRDFHAERE